MQSKIKMVAVLATATWLVPATTHALGSDCSNVTRSSLVPCALRQSLSIQSEQRSVSAAAAREAAADPILPSNPQLELGAAGRRTPDGAGGFSWSARLSQEVELAGQRGLRRIEAAAGSAAAREHLTSVQRGAAARAWTLYFEIARGERQRQIAARFEASARQVSEAAQAMSGNGVLSPLDADLATMSWSRAKQRALSLDREIRGAKAELTGLLTGDPTASTPSIAADLEPLSGVEVFARRALGVKHVSGPELRALEAEQRASSARVRLLRRTRIPNLTFGAFMEYDRFEGQRLGGTLSIPIPLPEPLGRTASGEIAEAEALAERALTETERVRRDTFVAMTRALSDYESRRAELDLLSVEQAALCERSLGDLAAQVTAGRVRIREALVTEQQLIDFLVARVEAEHALCLTSVLLAQAASFPLESETP